MRFPAPFSRLDATHSHFLCSFIPLFFSTASTFIQCVVSPTQTYLPLLRAKLMSRSITEHPSTLVTFFLTSLAFFFPSFSFSSLFPRCVRCRSRSRPRLGVDSFCLRHPTVWRRDSPWTALALRVIFFPPTNAPFFSSAVIQS